MADINEVIDRIGRKDFDELAKASHAVLNCMFENYGMDEDREDIIRKTDELTNLVAELEDIIAYAYME